MSEVKLTPKDSAAVAAAKVKQLTAEAAVDNARAKLLRYEGDVAVHEVKRQDDRAVREAATDYEYRFLRFNEPVNSKTARNCTQQLAQWSRIDPGCHIKIQFNSPGGDVTEGMALFDEIQHFRRQGHKITTSTVGMAASMAGILLQAGDVRKIAPEAWLMIHQASFGAVGSTYEIDDRVEWIKKIQSRILDIFAERAAGSEATHPITRKKIIANWNRKDWWVSSDDALKYGLVDEVG